MILRIQLCVHPYSICVSVWKVMGSVFGVLSVALVLQLPTRDKPQRYKPRRKQNGCSCRFCSPEVNKQHWGRSEDFLIRWELVNGKSTACFNVLFYSRCYSFN